MEIIGIETATYEKTLKEIENFLDTIDKLITASSQKTIGKWLDNQEVANLLRISTKTLQRLRKENLISYSMLRGRCRYKLSEIERGLNEKIIVCDPHTLDEFRRNFLFNGNYE